MSKFIRLLEEKDKGRELASLSSNYRSGFVDSRIYSLDPKSFSRVPGKPFAYWVSDAVRSLFQKLPAFDDEERAVKQGLATADDFRFVRVWWEVPAGNEKWTTFAKGGAFSRFYVDMPAVVNWRGKGREIKNNLNDKGGIRSNIWMLKDTEKIYFHRPGLTWPLRGIRFSSQVVPMGCAFSVAGKMAFAPKDELTFWLAIFNSSAFDYLVRMFAGKVGGVQYEVGLIGQVPVVSASNDQAFDLASLARRGWSINRRKFSVNETSHAFVLPAPLRSRLGDYEPSSAEGELDAVQAEINNIVFDLYGFTGEDRQVAQVGVEAASIFDEDNDDADQIEEAPPLNALRSWAGGVAFGYFDWRLAIGEREVPPEPDPFDPLPAKSPGMLPDGAEPYHRHAGILVDDLGHEHDLPRLMADVLETVDAQVNEDLRRWLRRDFFKYHLQQYSKSRRKAPIYWPLATASSSYTLWLYYPDLTDQTLFTAVNDFVEPKLKQVDSEVVNLRMAGTSRSRADEKRLEELSDFRDELADLRDTLLTIAPGYKPTHDDGVQITSAPLWPLFRHKSWQKVLKETWEKLEQGDYDWAHLAMDYWPERVREKCVTDKSLAIAHDLEHLYVEPEPAPKKARGRKKSTGRSE